MISADYSMMLLDFVASSAIAIISLIILDRLSLIRVHLEIVKFI